MPLDISTDAIKEKNKMNSDGTWLLLVEIQVANEDPIRVVLNNEQITWNSQTWLPIDFQLSGFVETKDGELPSIPLTLRDLRRDIIPILKEHGGGVGYPAIIRVVHSKFLSNTTPELEEITEILDCNINESATIQLKLGNESLVSLACPSNRYLKNHCRFAFKGTDGRCGYSGSETQCNRTFARCKELNNSTRYGGFVGVGTVGIQV